MKYSHAEEDVGNKMLKKGEAYLIVTSAILLSGSLYYSTYFKNWLLAPFFCYLFLLTLINRNNIFFCKNRILISLLIIIYTSLNINAQISSLFVLSVCIISALIISSLIDFDQFSEFYIRIIKFLCITSWLFLIPLKLQLTSFLPDLVNLIDLNYSNFIFFGIMRPDYPESFKNLYYTTRNSGIFWEPAAYQIFINLAFYFQILRRSKSKINIIIFGLTILSCGSTLGIVVYFILLLTFIIENNYLNLKIYLILISLFIFSILINKDHLEKLKPGTEQNISYQSRAYDILLDKNLIDKNPIFGIGYGNLSERDNEGYRMLGNDYRTVIMPTGSNGITLLIAYLGIIVGPIIIFLLVSPSLLYEFKIVTKILLLCACIGIFSSQNMFSYILPWLLIIYGINRR